MSQEDSYYSNDEEYFLDLCRGNEIQEIKEFITQLPQNSQFNWGWFNNTGDNFVHMIAANNFPNLFQYLLPVIVKRCPQEQINQILNKQNNTRSTPLHYAVVTESKDMVKKLLQAGADPQLTNQSNRTPLQQAQKFQKYQIAQILAPVTKTDLQALRKQVGDVKLNDDSSDQEEQQLPTIQQKSQQKHQQAHEYKKQETKQSQEKKQKVN